MQKLELIRSERDEYGLRGLIYGDAPITRERVAAALPAHLLQGDKAYLWWTTNRYMREYSARQDVPMSLQGAGTEATPAETLMIARQTMATYERIREIASEIIRDHGSTVYLAAEDPYVKDASESRWKSLKSHPHLAAKRANNELYRGDIGVPKSPYLVDEKFQGIGPAGIELLVLAPNLKGISNLKEAIGQLPFDVCKSVLVDVMNGCKALHDAGLVHCDIKTANAMVNRNPVRGRKNPDRVKANYFGQLDDLEMTERDGSRNEAYATTNYRGNLDKGFYSYPMRDEVRMVKAIDIFSLGLVILEVYFGGDKGGFSKFMRKFSDDVRHKEMGPPEMLRFFDRAIKSHPPKNPIPRETALLLMKMIRRDRNLRPNIDEVIEEFSKNN